MPELRHILVLTLDKSGLMMVLFWIFNGGEKDHEDQPSSRRQDDCFAF